MYNYKLLVCYDGTGYSGWQIQSNTVTVQQKIIDSIEIIAKEKVNLIGSGRTDSGVHALGQVANFRSGQQLDLYKFRYSLNAVLPNDISVIGIETVDEKFHSRFDAKRRSYLYIFSHIKSPFFEKYSYMYPPVEKIEISNLNSLSSILLGEHDFTSFSKKNTEIDEKKCTIYEIRWRRSGDKTIFYISANRFLHGMVRTIVGTVLSAAEKQMDKNHLLDVLAQKDRTEAEESVPAKGLFLFKVRY